MQKCLDYLCCAESNATMMIEKLSASTPSATNIDVLPTILPRVLYPQDALLMKPFRCSTMPPDLAVPVANLRAETKTDQKVLDFLNEERKQVILHTNNTHDASTNDCVRYFDIGKEKQESDDNSRQARRKAGNCSPKKSLKAENRSEEKSPKLKIAMKPPQTENRSQKNCLKQKIADARTKK